MLKKNILITGGTGLIGGNFIKLYSNKYNFFNINSQAGEKTYKYDLSKIQNFSKIANNFEILIYLAQSNNYKDSKNNLNETININYENFKNISNRMLQGNSLQKIIYASSGNVYDESNISKDEYSPLKINFDNDVYSYSKILSENFLNKLDVKVDIFIARIFFAYGKEQKN